MKIPVYIVIILFFVSICTLPAINAFADKEMSGILGSRKPETNSDMVCWR